MAVRRSSFVGRAAELQRVLAAFGEHRLVSITGLGGTGKTRLAVEVAAAAKEHFPGGVAIVELASVTSAEGVVAVIAASVPRVRLPSGPDPLLQLAAELQHRQLLLVLDNCEHVLAATSEVTDRLLDACPSLAILATSREPLHLLGEQVLRLTPLDVEPCTLEAPSPAVRLFIDRASAVQAGFELADSDLCDVMAICRQVDGIPLAIELAAARVAHLSLAEIAQRLTQQRVLASRSPTVADRHRSLTSAIEWSYDLLPAAEQAVFRRLGVFASAATLAAIEAVCAAGAQDGMLDTISSLVDKSLVTVDHRDGCTRYGMIGTVRRHAQWLLERSGESDAVERRHATWFASHGQAAEPRADDLWPGALQAELDDVLAALRWANRAQELDVAHALAVAAARGCEITGRYADGRDLLETTLRLDTGEHARRRARTLLASAELIFASGGHAIARQRYQEAIDELRVHGRSADLARALNSMATTLLFEGDAGGARGLAEEALRRFDQLGADDAGRAFARSSLGMIEARLGHPRVAERHLLEALRLFRRLGRRQQAADVLNHLGNLAADAGAPGRAHRFYEGALQLQRQIGDDRGAALSLNNLSIVAQQRGSLDHAWEHAQAAYELFTAVGDRPGQAATVNNLANLAAELGQPQQAVALYGESISAFRAMRDGRRMATALTNLADLAADLGQRQLAWDCHVDAASVWNQLTEPDQVAASVRSLARLARQWSMADLCLPLDPGEGYDPETVSHLLEAARWAPVPSSREQRAPSTGTLTPRETEVVRQVARGMSNAEIAAQLFISERTVESHVSNARQKLGVDSRTKLTRWAIEHGLTP